MAVGGPVGVSSKLQGHRGVATGGPMALAKFSELQPIDEGNSTWLTTVFS